MSLIGVVIALVAIGLVLWLVNTYLPLDGTIKRVLNIVVLVIVVLWLLSIFGILGHVNDVKVPHI